METEFSAIEVARGSFEAHGFACRILDDYTGLLARFSNGSTSFLLREGTYPINSATSIKVCVDKAHTYQALQDAGFRIPVWGHFFVVPEYFDIRPQGRELSDAFRFAESLGYPVFVKPINGSLGRNASIATNDVMLGHRLVEIGRTGFAAIVQEVVEGAEHRAFVLDGQVHFTYRKKPIQVVGNGRDTIATLLKSAQLAGTVLIDNHGYLTGQPYMSAQLSQDHVPNDGEIVALSENANPNVGAVIDDFRTDVSDAFSDWAIQVASAMGLRVCGIDFFSPSNINAGPDEFTIIEVNGNPLLNTIWRLGHCDIVHEIWRKIAEATVRDLSP